MVAAAQMLPASVTANSILNGVTSITPILRESRRATRFCNHAGHSGFYVMPSGGHRSARREAAV